jgi:hypothetical protein
LLAIILFCIFETCQWRAGNPQRFTIQDRHDPAMLFLPQLMQKNALKGKTETASDAASYCEVSIRDATEWAVEEVYVSSGMLWSVFRIGCK